MTLERASVQPKPSRHLLVASLLLLGFCASLTLRVVMGRPDVAHSAVAGLVFASCLVTLAIFKRTSVVVSRRVIISGITGGILLCIPALMLRVASGAHHTPAGNYVVWTLVVSVVAFAEEAFLRGALYDATADAGNQMVAIIVTAVAFAVLHVPLYGLTSVPLDFTVGLVLGSLRLTTDTFVAPGIAHILADLAGWWIK